MLNRLEDVITVEECAVSNSSGTANFLVHSSHSMGRLAGDVGRKAQYSSYIQVRTIALDEFCYEFGNPLPDLIKVDIEGGGFYAAQGMREIVAKKRPIMLAELHGPEESKAIWTLLVQNGYGIYRLNRERTRITEFSELNWKEYIAGIPTETKK
ncbi:MAG: FkbM family methyltransferase [candidate division WOR-3 bacterium]